MQVSQVGHTHTHVRAIVVALSSMFLVCFVDQHDPFRLQWSAGNLAHAYWRPQSVLASDEPWR